MRLSSQCCLIKRLTSKNVFMLTSINIKIAMTIGTHLAAGTTAWQPRANRYDSEHFSLVQAQNQLASVRRNRLSTDFAASRHDEEHAVYDSMRALLVTGIGIDERCDDPGRQHVVPCTARDQCSDIICNILFIEFVLLIVEQFVLTTYSNTKVKVSRVWIMSWSVTMFECLSSFSKDASRIAVNGAPSSSCRRISFKAITWFVRLFVFNKNNNVLIIKNVLL